MNVWDLDIVNIAYFVSGSGSNFHALETHFRTSFPRAAGSLVIGSRDQIGAKQKAEHFGIPFKVASQHSFLSEDQYSEHLEWLLSEFNIHLICLAGYLSKIPRSIIHIYQNRILNIHPALLPAFGGKGMYGLHVHKAVLARGCKITGATIHFVTENYDEGPIILQQVVPVLETDSPETLQKRVLEVEHQLYPLAVERVIGHQWKVENGIFSIKEHHASD